MRCAHLFRLVDATRVFQPWAVDPERLRGRRCLGGLDLSATTDITALAWVFPPDGDNEPWHVVSR